MIKDSFEELRQSDRFPSPSGVGMQILKITQCDDYSTDEIGHVIMADSALTARLLQLANAAMAGSMNPIATVDEAIVRLGIRAVRNITLGLSLIPSNRSGACRGFDYDRYWSRSLARAVAAQSIAEHAGVGVPAEMYVLGLLSEVGRLALASVHPERYSELLARTDQHSPGDLVRLERECFEIDHCEVAACMLDEWGLPATFSKALREYEFLDFESAGGELHTMAEVLHAAQVVAQMCTGSASAEAAEWQQWTDGIVALRHRMRLNDEEFLAFYRSIVPVWREWGEALRIPTRDPLEFRKLVETIEQSSAAPAPTAATPFTCSTPHEEREAGGGQEGLRVLAVDDDPTSLKLLERHLVRAGHSVTVAHDGNEALRLALETTPQLVIADWQMPELDGLKLCAALRRIESGRRIYFLLLTGRAQEETIVEAFEAGVDDYVEKPFVPKVLLARIKGGRRIIDLQDRVEKDQRTMQKQVVELQLLTRRLRSAALTDVLTNLPNRRYAMKRLTQVWESANRTGNPVSIVMIDIDHFKRVNDEHGHDTGDAVLKETAATLRTALREDEDVCRLGGEEFLVICPNTRAHQACMLAERLRKVVAERIVRWGDFDGAVTISLGVAEKTARMETHDALLKVADEAIYAAKKGGRNRVCKAPKEPPQARSA